MSINSPSFEEKRQADRRQIPGRRFNDIPVPKEVLDEEESEFERRTGPGLAIRQFLDKFGKYLNPDEIAGLSQLAELMPKRKKAMDLQEEIRQKREEESIEQGILEEIMRDAEIVEDEIELPEAA